MVLRAMQVLAEAPARVGRLLPWARAVVQVPRVQPKMRLRVELLEIQVRAARLVGRELGVAVWLSYRHRGAWPGRRGRR